MNRRRVYRSSCFTVAPEDEHRKWSQRNGKVQETREAFGAKDACDEQYSRHGGTQAEMTTLARDLAALVVQPLRQSTHAKNGIGLCLATSRRGSRSAAALANGHGVVAGTVSVWTKVNAISLCQLRNMWSNP